ncbi:MAG: hypothetical protein EBU08_20735 [Micrococcales bacterium]|nr:hypothetical protein [Micrococcales bacterium]
MLIKDTTVDKIEIVENGIVQVRQITKIIEYGEEISRSYHRLSLVPGQSLADQDARVQAVCNAVWTSEVIAAYQDSRLGLQ